jgi:uncharacterized protein (TIGR00251 family)
MFTPDGIRQAVTAREQGTLLTIEVTAGSKTESFPSGYNVWRKAAGIQVKAPAVEGKANKAIISLVADTLDVPKTSVQIVSGQTSSVKKILISGMNPEILVDRLVHLLNSR